MRNWIWLLAVLMTLSFGTALAAQGEAKPEPVPEGKEKEGEEAKEEDPLEKFKAIFKGADDVIGKTTVTEDSVKSYLAHHSAFRVAMEKDKKFTELKEKNLKEAFDHAVKSEVAIAFAKENGIKLEPWLRGAVRIMVLATRTQIKVMVDEQKEGLAEYRKLVESQKETLTEEEYKEVIKQLDEGDAALKAWGDLVDTLPKPSEAEEKVMKANAEKIAAAMEEGDDKEDGDEKDDMD